MNRTTAWAATALVSALALAGCASVQPSESTAPQAQDLTLTLAPVGDVLTFAPQQAGDGHAVQWSQPVYDTLVRQLPDGEFTGMLARSWSYDEAQTTLTLELEDGVTFDDGTPLDADAVRVNLEATRDGTGPLSTQLASIAEIVPVDDDTVELRLSAPDPSLIRGLSQPSGMIANPASVGTEALAAVPDGTGPYVLDVDKTVRGSQYVFTRKDDYWNTELELPYETLVYRPMTDITARTNALMAGEIDGTYIDAKTMTAVESAGLPVVTYPAAGIVGLFILDRAGSIVPALADVRVRQAINMAFDRAGMLAQFREGLGTVSEQPFNPQSDAWVEELNETYEQDVAAARALITDAGYVDGITIQVPEVAMFPESTIVAQALADIGVTVEWAKVAQTELLNEMRSGKYPVIFMQLQASDPWQTIQFFVSPTAPWNVLKTTDPEVDALIDRAQFAADADERAEVYHELNRYLVDEGWFAPFYFPANIYATATDTVVVPQYQQGVPSIYNFAPAN